MLKNLEHLKKFTNFGPKNIKVIMLVAAVIFLLVSSIIISRTERKNDNAAPESPVLAKTYHNDQYKFDIKYPYRLKEGDNELNFSGKSMFSKILILHLYPDKTINTVIDDYKAKYPGQILEEKDVKINVCTSRKISISLKDKNYLLYFLTTGPKTYVLEVANNLSTEDKQLADDIVNSLNCF